MNPENALLSRVIEDNGDGKTVTISEIWDLNSPDCPYIRLPWSTVKLSDPPPNRLKAIFRDAPKLS